MERYLPMKPGQPMGMALVWFVPFPKSLIRTKNRFVKNGTANFGRNIPTEISGPPPDVIPTEYPGQKKPRRISPLEFQPKFPESLA